MQIITWSEKMFMDDDELDSESIVELRRLCRKMSMYTKCYQIRYYNGWQWSRPPGFVCYVLGGSWSWKGLGLGPGLVGLGLGFRLG